VTTLTPQAFAKRCGESTLSERSSYQQHFLDLCEMLGAPKPGLASAEVCKLSEIALQVVGGALSILTVMAGEATLQALKPPMQVHA
jgi:hypothetical protein